MSANTPQRTLITSALPYANGYVHLGHCAGAYLPADMYVRWLRANDHPVLYICGSDEYGVAITIAAEKEGISPQEVADKYHAANAQAFAKFGMSFDRYDRTSDPRHITTVHDFFTDLHSKDLLKAKEEEQFYDPVAAMFLPDRYVEGTCPNCGYDKARGDQCDKCGAYYDQLQLGNPRSLVSGNTPEVRKTKHWYFQFGNFQEFLEEYIGRHEADWKENVVQQSWSWLKQGLSERAVTRDLSWGVPVPLDDAQGKVVYVWFDAVLGYISATKNWAAERGTPEEWKTWWCDPATRYLAFIGKDNIVFHTLMFPAMLQARGGYVLPDNVPANEFLNLEGEKFSKSRQWAVDLRDFQEAFPEPFHTDALRYTLAMNMPETRDADFTWRDFQSRLNNELAAIPGNFVNRTLQFIGKYFDGKVPAPSADAAKFGEAWQLLVSDLQEGHGSPECIEECSTKYMHYFSAHDVAAVAAAVRGIAEINNRYERFRFRDVALEAMNVARAANKYFNDAAPWKSIKENPQNAARTLWICVQLARTVALLLSPITPHSSLKILELIGAAGLPTLWSTLLTTTVESGTPLPEPTIVFGKVEDSAIEEQVAKLKSPAVAPVQADVPAEVAPLPESIGIEDFGRIALRTAVVVEAEKVKKSKKLLRLIVDLGNERRQILAGIAEHYTPESMIGRTVVVVANLKPATLMGLESQGMLLAVNSSNGTLSLVGPDAAVAPGQTVR